MKEVFLVLNIIIPVLIAIGIIAFFHFWIRRRYISRYVKIVKEFNLQEIIYELKKESAEVEDKIKTETDGELVKIYDEYLNELKELEFNVKINSVSDDDVKKVKLIIYSKLLHSLIVKL